MPEMMPRLREALLAYDPKAKVVQSIRKIGTGVFSLQYLDTDRKTCYFTFREREIFHDEPDA